MIQRWKVNDTHLTTCGAITLQGPHQVAKQSRTMRVPSCFMASSNSALVLRLWTPSLLMFAVAVKLLVGCVVVMVGMMRDRVGVRSTGGVVVFLTKRAVVSKAVRLSAEDARDIQRFVEGGRGMGFYVVSEESDLRLRLWWKTLVWLMRKRGRFDL